MFNRRVFHYAVPSITSSIQWGWIHVGLSLNAYDKSSWEVNVRTGILAVVCVLISLLTSVGLRRALCEAHSKTAVGG